MKRKRWILTLLIGFFAAAGHYKYVHDLKDKTVGGDKVEVLSLSENIPAGEEIVREKLASRMIPSSYIDERAVRSDKIKEVLGLSAALNLKSGHTLLWTDFQTHAGAAGSDLADLLESGQRAVTISVDASLSMGGLLRPGHRVDILCTFGQKLMQERYTVTLLQNVTVLAVGRTVGDLDDVQSKIQSSFKTVTLGVGLEDAERLSLAAKQGVLSLALRGRQDITVVQGVPKISATELIPGKKSSEQKHSAESIKVIERIKRR